MTKPTYEELVELQRAAKAMALAALRELARRHARPLEYKKREREERER